MKTVKPGEGTYPTTSCSGQGNPDSAATSTVSSASRQL